MTISQHPIAIGVSSCLLGNNIRYNGANKFNQDVEKLCAQFECIAICPEIAIDLGVPRSPIKLCAQANSTRALQIQPPYLDVTLKLKQYAQDIQPNYPQICGFIFKSRSPSCGLTDVPTFDCDENPIRLGRGVFADMLSNTWKDLPIIDEIQLENPTRLAEFIDAARQYMHSKLPTKVRQS